MFNNVTTCEVYTFEGKWMVVPMGWNLSHIANYLYETYGYELDEHTTLEQWLDHDWIRDNHVAIINTFSIMTTPLSVLVSNYRIYDMVK